VTGLLQQVWVPFAPEQASSFAPEVDALYLYLTALTLFFSVGISLAIVYFAIKYRRRAPTEVPRPRAGAIALELTWTIIPLMIAMTIFVWGASLYFKLYRAPEEAMEIYVVGKQWMWKFQHREGQREINELHVPVGARVRLVMTTEDVIHSFYVPAFRIKMDVVPGRYSYAWFEATKPGKYYLFCAEYCGTNHSGMGGYVYVMEPNEYQAWLSGGATDSPAAQGRKLMQDRGCATCHQEDTVLRAPALRGLFGSDIPLAGGALQRVDEDYVRRSIEEPQAQIHQGFEPIMPTYKGQLSAEQLLQIIAYLRSIGSDTRGAGATMTTTEGRAGGTTTGAGPVTGSIPPDTQRSNPVGPTQPAAGRTGQQPSQTTTGTGQGRRAGAANSNR